MARIVDVAERAGVSVGTVSRVINSNPRVTPALRARVEAAIAALDYRPNALARSLRRQRTHTLGLVIPDITSPYFAELARWIEAAAARAGYCLILGNSAGSQREEQLYIETLVDRRVDGLILVPSHARRTLPCFGMPVVVVDRELPDADVIVSDNEGGAREVTEYLVGLGHEVIACIGGPRDLPVALQRHAGYVSGAAATLARRGLTPGAYTRWGSYDYQSGYDLARVLLALAPRPTAIVASSDQQAVGALRACADLGLAVPGDVSVTGFDDIPLAWLVTPRLTTVAQPVEETAARAVERLLARTAEPRLAPRREVLPTIVRVRDSCAPPRGDQ